MNSQANLDRNLLALGTRHPHLSAALSKASSDPQISAITSRSGLQVPALYRDGRQFPMHSRFNPQAEGKRMADAAPDGFLVAFGIGAAYHLTPLLERQSLTGLLIVESSLSTVRSILELFDLTGLLSDSRVLLSIDPSPAQLKRLVLDRYLPVLYGNLGSISLRSRWDAEPVWFHARAEALRDLPEALSRDFTVQARFGRRWFVHTLPNHPRSEESGAVLSHSRKVIITAAGPSLENQFSRIRSLQSSGATLIATDTSLPALCMEGITPNVVLSIDCQAVSYHHFLAGLPAETILVLDLASPPLLTRLSNRILFYSSGHPFSLYINRLYRPFPILDLSGGNVTHAALSLAELAGAHEAYLFGADFCYPHGKPYAGGTYIFPYFHSRSCRTQGSEDAFWTFIDNSHPRREKMANSWRFRTASMDHYRESLETAAGEMRLNLIPEPGDGVRIETENRNSTGLKNQDSAFLPFLSAGGPMKSWQDFLNDYIRRLEALPSLVGPPQDYLAALAAEDRQVWATLLPLAASFRKLSENGPQAVEKARLWTLKRLKNASAKF